MPGVPLPPPEPIRLVSLARIASGGMGSVELARAEGGRLDGRVLAIKRLHANVARDPQFVGMFLDEAWMTAALDHPNVVRVAAWGQDEAGMFLAVELVQGVSLLRLLKEAASHGEPFAERTVAFIGSQIAAALGAAHALTAPDGTPLGLVHRDLTPGNVLVAFDGVVKIADFGIARAEERITHTRTGTLKGKPAYMAPEQARGAKVDGRADLFSLGVVLFEMLAGRRPFTAKGAFDVMMQVATAPTPDLRALRRNVSPELVEVVERCLAKAPADRFATAGEVQARLDAWRRARGFEHDDVASLAQFVRRNATRQMEWFERALRGELASSAAPSFKEMEEQIDEGRVAKDGARGSGPPGSARPRTFDVRPAAGRPAEGADAPAVGDPYATPAPPAAPLAAPSGSITESDFAATRVLDDGRAAPASMPHPASSRAGAVPIAAPITGSDLAATRVLDDGRRGPAPLPHPRIGTRGAAAPATHPPDDGRAAPLPHPSSGASGAGAGVRAPASSGEAELQTTMLLADAGAAPPSSVAGAARGLDALRAHGALDAPYPYDARSAPAAASLAARNAASGGKPRRARSRVGVALLAVGIPLAGAAGWLAWRYLPALLGSKAPGAAATDGGPSAP